MYLAERTIMIACIAYILSLPSDAHHCHVHGMPIIHIKNRLSL
jgi:hypothetical protein